MRSVQKLVRNGNSTQVTIVRPILIALGWIPGGEVVVELLEDQSLHIYPLQAAQRARPSQRPTLLTELNSPPRR